MNIDDVYPVSVATWFITLAIVFVVGVIVGWISNDKPVITGGPQ